MYEFYNKWAVEFIALLMKDFNLSVEDAAAIVGNAGHESGGFKSLQEIKPLVPGSKGGYGIMQWTGPRRREYEAYCKRNNLNPADMMTNYKFLYVELKGPEGKVLPKLKATVAFDKKVEVFSSVFLRPGIPHMDSRKVWARRALEAWNNRQPQKPTQEPVQSVPDGGVGRTSSWLVQLLLGLLRLFMKKGK